MYLFSKHFVSFTKRRNRVGSSSWTSDNNAGNWYSDDFSKAQGLNQLWQRDTTSTAVIADNDGFRTRQSYLIQQPTVKGKFSFRIPFKHIFGFCEDYDRIVCGLKHTLTPVRKSSDDAIVRANAADAGKVSLDKIPWFVPHVLPADAEKFPL